MLNNPDVDDSIEFLPGETPLNPADPNNQYPARVIDGQGRTVYLVTTGDNYAVFEDIPASRKILLPATYEQALVEYLLTFPVADGLPTIPASDPRYVANVNQRIFGIPLP